MESWVEDLEPLDNADGSLLPSGMSDIASKKPRKLRERAGLKLNDVVLILEKIFEEFERIT